MPRLDSLKPTSLRLICSFPAEKQFKNKLLPPPRLLSSTQRSLNSFVHFLELLFYISSLLCLAVILSLGAACSALPGLVLWTEHSQRAILAKSGL